MSGGDDVGSEEEAWVWLAVEVKKVTVEERERERAGETPPIR